MTKSTFPSDVHATRLRRAAELAAERGIGSLVFGTGPDLEYLIGSRVSSHERLTALAVPVAKQGARPVFVLPAVERGDLPASAVPDLDVDVVLWSDGDDPHRLVADALGLDDGATLAVGASLTADHLLPILDATGARPVLAGETLRELFMRKDDAEIEQLRDAAAAIDRVHARVPSMLRPGRTEADVAEELTAAILEEGHSAVDFVIVGSGPNGANPHHDFSDRVLDDGDVVVVDIGGTWGVGYHSDCTRTYAIGDAPEKATAAWEVLRAAQEAAVAAVRPGATAADIDDAARSVIADAGFGDNFIHRTGHGIGLSLHEEPFIMVGNDLVLEPGMAFSVEPGLYFEGEIGMRLEDIVVVTDDGAESLNRGPHELVAAAGTRAGEG
ncbi:Xaa-Pro peptidase family protein [uncultured Corynebacterium sp.]|uniref:M24 family metallopeptidase n=1 Tax=uncultured Corynebacterium sp. TaxID=159447 RepID=UPI0025F5B120|nr:Xaa-Pro peptidase family protein [uncultured Corynebacterium sp.]